MEKENSKQSGREAVRVETSFIFEFRLLDGGEVADCEKEIANHRTNERLGLPQSSQSELPSELNNLKDYQETAPQQMKMWISIEQKLDALLKLVGQKTHQIPDSKEGIVKDLSSKGVKIKTDVDLKKGDRLMMRLSPPTFPSFTIDVVGKVVGSKTDKEGGSFFMVETTALNPDDREILIAYVFKRQREILRQRLDEETDRMYMKGKENG